MKKATGEDLLMAFLLYMSLRVIRQVFLVLHLHNGLVIRLTCRSLRVGAAIDACDYEQQNNEDCQERRELASHFNAS